jgi:hypothetical protein
MGTERRKQLVLGALIALLGVLAYRAIVTSPRASSSSNPTRPSGANGRGGRATALAGGPEVHLDALSGERPKPIGPERNLFRFKPKAPPAPLPVARGGEAAPPSMPPPSSGTASLPPIALKFIGTVQKDGGRTTFAVLTDGQGPPMSGKEGDTIAGRYKILRIGVESIEMSYLDGRGRQTIRINTGS